MARAVAMSAKESGEALVTAEQGESTGGRLALGTSFNVYNEHRVSSRQEGDDRQCWICLQSGGEDLIAPCHCRGSVKWVHRSCLNRWRVDAKNSRNFTHCRHCDFEFRLVLRRDPTQDESTVKQRKQRFLLKTVSHFALTTIFIQVSLLLLAMLIRAIDQKEELVTLFGFPQVEHTPPAGEGDFLNAFSHHKSTYYLAAVLVGLFIAGVTGVLMCCASACHCRWDPCPDVVSRRGFGGGGGMSQDPFQQYLCMRGCGDCCEFCGDCCFYCGRSDGCCLDCCPNGGGNCLDGCDCSCPVSSDSGDSAMAILVIIAVVVVVAFILIGLILVFMALVTWIQKVVTRYLQIAELRQLAGEYVVEDLSIETPEPSAPPAISASAQAPLQENMQPSAPPAPSSFAPITDATIVNQSLMRDLQAVYGCSGLQDSGTAPPTN